MKCPACLHENEGGNFCEECGTKLVQSTVEETASTIEQNNSNVNVNTPPNQYVEGAKKVSKMYFRFFIGVLKKPYSSSLEVGSEHLINGLITIILYAIIIPLMMYLGIKNIFSTANSIGDSLFGGDTPSFNPPFTDLVIIPAFAYAIFILLVATFSFLSIKLGKVPASYKAVISRFGAFLIPFVAILLVALIMSLLKIGSFIFFLSFGFITSIFLVPALVIVSFKKDYHDGLDAIYGTLLTYILTIITLVIMGNILFEALKNTFSSPFSLF